MTKKLLANLAKVRVTNTGTELEYKTLATALYDIKDTAAVLKENKSVTINIIKTSTFRDEKDTWNITWKNEKIQVESTKKDKDGAPFSTEAESIRQCNYHLCVIVTSAAGTPARTAGLLPIPYPQALNTWPLPSVTTCKNLLS